MNYLEYIKNKVQLNCNDLLKIPNIQKRQALNIQLACFPFNG